MSPQTAKIAQIQAEARISPGNKNQATAFAGTGKGIWLSWRCFVRAELYLPSPPASATPVTGSGGILSGSLVGSAMTSWRGMASAAGPAVPTAGSASTTGSRVRTLHPY